MFSSVPDGAQMVRILVFAAAMQAATCLMTRSMWRDQDVVVGGSERSTRQSKECPVSRTEADQCLSRLMTTKLLGREENIRTLEDVEAHCKYIRQNLNCFESHATCLPALVRQAVGFFIYRGEAEYKKWCSSSKGRRQLESSLGCLSESEADAANLCMSELATRLQFVAKTNGKATMMVKTASTCCSFTMFRTCLRNSTLDGKCPSAGKAFDGVVESIGGDLMRFGCGRQLLTLDGCRDEPYTELTEQLVTAHKDPDNGGSGIYEPLMKIFLGI